MAIGTKELTLVFKAATEKAQKNIDNVGKGLKNVGKSGKIAKGGLLMMGTGFKFVGAALKAAGIGLFITLLAQLTGMFSQNQKVADAFGRIMLKLQPIFQIIGNNIAFVAEVLEKVIDLFTQAIDWIGGLFGVTKDAADATAGYAGDIVRLRKEVKLMNAELALTQLQYQKEAELQRQIRDDTSLTMDERIAANEQLGRILEKQAEEEKEMALVALELAEKELALDSQNIDLQVALIDAKTKLAEIDERITGQRSEQLTNLNSLEKERVDIENQQNEMREKRLKELIDLQNKDLEVKKDIRTSITDQLETAKDAHNQIMSMYKQELAMEIKLLKEAEERTLLQIQNQEKAAKASIEASKMFIGLDPTFAMEQVGMINNQEEKTLKAVEETNEKILQLEKEYNELMGEVNDTYYKTEEELILQAAEKLDRHFETEKEKELRETEEQYDLLFGYAENDAERTALLEEEKRIRIQEINDKYDKTAEKSTTSFMDKMFKFNKKLVDKEIELEKKKNEATQKSIQMGMALAGEGSAAAKALAIANTIIATKAGVMQVFDDVETPTPLKWIQAGLLVATGMKNLSDIQKTKIPGGKGGGGGETMSDDIGSGGGDMGGQVPSITFGDAGSEAPPVQAFVVETDISNAQALQSELDLQSTL